jgi:hypothetical protein
MVDRSRGRREIERVIRRNLSLRPPPLSGEISILDKNEFSMTSRTPHNVCQEE